MSYYGINPYSPELYHHGILGMKWGIRRTKEQLRSARGKTASEEKAEAKAETKKRVSDMSDEELRAHVARLGLEKQYRDAVREANKVNQPSNKGKAFVMDVLEKSGKNIATQLVTYAFGTAVNKAFNAEIVNPKKGQKDK